MGLDERIHPHDTYSRQKLSAEEEASTNRRLYILVLGFSLFLMYEGCNGRTPEYPPYDALSHASSYQMPTR
jgi:hypothetical protein